MILPIFTLTNAQHGCHILWHAHPYCPWACQGSKPVKGKVLDPAIGWAQRNIILRNRGRSLLPKRWHTKYKNCFKIHDKCHTYLSRFFQIFLGFIFIFLYFYFYPSPRQFLESLRTLNRKLKESGLIGLKEGDWQGEGVIFKVKAEYFIFHPILPW